MNVRIHIDRLVLDGLALNAADRPQLGAALESVLARLIAAGGLSPDLAHGAALPSLRAPAMTVARNAKPAAVGASIARAVYGEVGGRR